MNSSTYNLIILSFLVALCTTKDLPSYIKKCKRDYPEVNNCLVERAIELKPYLEKGIPEFKLPALKPLIIPKVEIHTGNGGPTDFKAKFVDIRVENGENFEVKKMDFDINNNKTELSIFLPYLHLRCIYTFNGNIMSIHLASTGPAEANLTDLFGNTHAKTKLITKNGKQYLDISDNHSVFKYSINGLRFDNIFEGNEDLTEQTNKAINENIADIGKEINPLVEKTIGNFLQQLIQRVFDEYSLNELFD